MSAFILSTTLFSGPLAVCRLGGGGGGASEPCPGAPRDVLPASYDEGTFRGTAPAVVAAADLGR